MSVKVPLSAGATSRVVDASRRDLSKVSQIASVSGGRLNVAAINLDGNNLSTLHGIKQFPSLIQLSVSDNSLVRMDSVAPLINLVSLNLQNNSLSEITGLERLLNLEWLCLAGNSIKVIDGLSSNVKISHLDLSDNCIGTISNTSILDHLKTLLLHGNAISSLDSVGQHLPQSLTTLSLAENDITDLNEVSFLSSLPSLGQLSLMTNPCVSFTDSEGFDYRPYVCYWCPGVITLDGFPVTDKERNYSSTLFPSDQPCPFTVGQHRELIRYLYSASPLHTAQLLTSSKIGDEGVPNNSTLTPLSGLEDVIKNYQQQPLTSDPKQADIVEKLRALQLVEQMIKSQEHLLLSQHKTSTNGKEAGKNQNQETETNGESGVSQKTVLNAWTESSPSKSFPISPPVLSEEPQIASQSEPATVSSTSSVPKTSTDQKTEQLRLLNAKIAQRHSKVIHKPNKATSHGSKSTKSRKTPQPLSNQTGPRPTETGKKTQNANQQLLKSRTVKSAKKSKPLVRPVSKVQSKPEKSHLKEVTLTEYHLPGVPIHPTDSHGNQTLTTHQPKTNKNHSTIEQPSTSKPSFSQATTSIAPDVSTTSMHTELDPDMLSSTSYYVPLTEDTIGDETLHSQFEAALEQDSEFGTSVLASSLTQAYGLSDLGEDSRVLSALLGPLDTTSTHLPSSTQEAKEPALRNELVPKSSPSPNEGVSVGTCQVEKPLFSKASPKSEHQTGEGYDKEDSPTVQSAWSDGRVCPTDTGVLGVGTELSGNELEEYVLQNATQLQGCRQELAHQSQLLQLQEEILQTLLVEVESLRTWKTRVEIEERRNAAIVLQKYWRGYSARKRSPYNRTVSSTRTDALWTLCLSMKKQMAEMRSTIATLTERAKKVRFETGHADAPAADLPPPIDLKMSHYSVSCILLRWSPAVTPVRPDETVLKCYRVYVNGEVEGMVGPEKCKAYIEGLDRGTTYRITVRAVYNTGESEDSNPVVASLNPSQTSPRSHSNSDHSSDEETGGTRKNLLPSFSHGESSGTQTQGEQTSTTNDQIHSQEHPPTNDNPDTPVEEEVIVADSTPLSIEVTDHIQTKSTKDQKQIIVSQSSLDKPVPDVPQETNTAGGDSPFHFQKAKHITIDTVSVLSGCTIEYSPPLPVASTSADTLLGESSLEYDAGSTESSSDTESTATESRKSVGNNGRKEDQGNHSSGLMTGNDSFVPEPKEAVSDVPNETPGVESTTHSVSHDDVTTVLTTHSVSHDDVTTVLTTHSLRGGDPLLVTPTSKHSLGMLAPMSSASVQGSDPMLSLTTGILHEQDSMRNAYFDSLPPHCGNNTGVLASEFNVCPTQPLKTMTLFSLQNYNKPELYYSTAHSDSSLDTAETKTGESCAVVETLSVTPLDIPTDLATSPTLSVQERLSPEQQVLPNSGTYPEISEAIGKNDTELGLNDEMPVTQVVIEQTLINAHSPIMVVENDTGESGKQNNVQPSKRLSIEQSNVQSKPTTTSIGDDVTVQQTVSLPEHDSEVNAHQSSSDVASFLLSELEKDLNKHA